MSHLKIDAGNVDQFIGKTVDAKVRRFHYYPLTIMKLPDGYCYLDSNGVIVMNDFEKEPIPYDTILEDVDHDE